MSFSIPFSGSIAMFIGWSLIHSLWLGGVIALGAATFMVTMRRATPHARFLVLLFLLLSIPLAATSCALFLNTGPSPAVIVNGAPATTDILGDQVKPLRVASSPERQEAGGGVAVSEAEETGIHESAAVSARPSIKAAPLLTRSGRLTQNIADWIPWIVSGWLCGVAVLSVRLLFGCCTLHRLASTGTSVVPDGVAEIAAGIAGHMQLRRTVRVLGSTLAAVPTTIGFFRPLILLPISTLTSLSAKELESILAHELAHIQRNDFLVNVIQVIAEVLLFYHPAVWWLSRRIRQEREYACDDIVIQVAGNRLNYARALAAVAETATRDQLAVAATDGQFTTARFCTLGNVDRTSPWRMCWTLPLRPQRKTRRNPWPRRQGESNMAQTAPHSQIRSTPLRCGRVSRPAHARHKGWGGRETTPQLGMVLVSYLLVTASTLSTTNGGEPADRMEDVFAAFAEWEPSEHNPLFSGTGKDTWDQLIRERGFILREGSNWHLWYTGYNPSRSKLKFLGYATSPDGIHWSRRPGNPIFKKSWVEDMCVVKLNGTYYMFAEGLNDIAHLLTSRDAVTWQDQGSLDIRSAAGEPLSAGPYGTPTIWVEDGLWYLFYERGDRGVWLATSTDRRVWKNVQDEPVIARGPEKYDLHAVAMNQVVRFGGKYVGVYHANADPKWQGPWTTCIAVSDDLVHWKKHPQNPVISSNDSSGILVHDGQKWRLYTMHQTVRLWQPRQP